MSTLTKNKVLKTLPLKQEFGKALKNNSLKALALKNHKHSWTCLEHKLSSLISSFPSGAIRLSGSSKTLIFYFLS